MASWFGAMRLAIERLGLHAPAPAAPGVAPEADYRTLVQAAWSQGGWIALPRLGAALPRALAWEFAPSAAPGAVLEALPDAISTPELHLKTAEGENYALMDKLKAGARFDGAREVITIDGLRVEYADGFGLARPSNTTPVVVLRFEADNAAALKRIQEDFRRAILAVKKDAVLPF